MSLSFWQAASLLPALLASQASPPLQLLPREGEIRLDGKALETGSWTAAAAGAVLAMDPGALAWLACPSGVCRELHRGGPLDPALFAEAGAPPCCRRSDGSRLVEAREDVENDAPAGAPEALAWCGRDWSFAALGKALLLGRARGDGPRWGEDPVLIAPRCPEQQGAARCGRRLAAPMEIVFAAAAGARRYAIDRLGPEPARLMLDPRQLDCRPWPRIDGREVCRLPWPADWRLPARGGELKLAVLAETAGGVRRSETSVLADLEDSRRPLLERRLARLAQLGDSEARRQRVALLLEAGLYGDLADELAAATSLDPPYHLALAYSYLHLELPELALFHFRSSLELTSEPAGSMGGDALFGVGLAELARGRTAAALPFFERATATYRAVGLSEEADQAAALSAASRPASLSSADR